MIIVVVLQTQLVLLIDWDNRLYNAVGLCITGKLLKMERRSFFSIMDVLDVCDKL